MRASFNDFMKNANVESNVFGVERFRSRDSANVGEEERRQRRGRERERSIHRAYDDDNAIYEQN